MGTKLATGLSKGENSAEVAGDAVRIAKNKLGKNRIDLAMVYCSSKYDYQAVVNTVRKLTDNAPLIGCSTGGEFTEEQVEHQSISVGLVSSDRMKFFTAIAEGIALDEVATIKKLAAGVPSRVEGYSELFAILLVDGLRGKGEEVTINASNIFGLKVKLVGGAAGDDLKFKQTFVFCNDKVASDAAAVCLVASQVPVFTGVKHGHLPLSEPLRITKAKGSVLYEVNNRPAWEVWKEKAAGDARTLGIEVEKLASSSEVGSFLTRYELGLPMDGKEFKIRIPLGKNDDGSLNFACTIPQGASFQIMKSIENRQITSAGEAMKLAKQEAGDTKIAGALIFDCVCRGLILGNYFHKAVEEFKNILGKNVPLLGWETYGEICMTAGKFSGFHNTTSVVLLLPAD